MPFASQGGRRKLARLNEAGLGTFAGWLETLKAGGSLLPPTPLLGDPQATEPLGTAVEVEPRTFASRLEAAKYLHDRFAAAGLADVEQDRGLWAWLSLFYFDAVCPPGRGGERNPGASARHIPESGNFQRYYRHLLAGRYRIYRAHRDDPQRALVVLCQPLDKPGDVVEQLASRQELITNRGIMALATRLYVDTATQRVKRGAGGKSGGSARRLSDVIEQFDLTWDLYAAAGEELAGLMPKEFERFLR
jgi:hypothetical protein